MREYMRTYPSYARETWREAFEKMLDTDPAQLVTFEAQQQSERKTVAQYISACLDRLIHTGIGRGNDKFVAFWVYDEQAWEITFPCSYHGWTRFAEDSDLRCSFVVIEKCLVNEVGRGCCHPQRDMPKEDIQRMLRDAPAVFETFLKISELAELPDGLCKRQRRDGEAYWSIRDLRNRKHCIKLGKQGKLEGESFCSKRVLKGGCSRSKRVLTGKWSPEGPIAATTRVISEIFAAPETHTEHICDDSEERLSPLPYHILDDA
jgi:hypothetical protein